IPFNEAEELLPVANDTNYGLAAGVFTRDISKAHRTAKRLRAGTVWINTYHVFDAAMPFGGYKESGWGREMGSQVLNNYLETKSAVPARGRGPGGAAPPVPAGAPPGRPRPLGPGGHPRGAGGVGAGVRPPPAPPGLERRAPGRRRLRAAPLDGRAPALAEQL